MKKPTLSLLLLIVIISACHKSTKFNEVKLGMPAKKVIELVGEPETKTPMFVVEWWNYPGENKLIVMSHDSVLRVVMDLKATQDSMKTLLSH